MDEKKPRTKKAARIALWALAAVFVLFSIASMVFIKLGYDEAFCRTVPRERTMYLRYADISGEYPYSAVRFMSGENELAGYVFGQQNTKGLVVMSHGMGGGAENYCAEIMAFVDSGFRVLAFDNTGCHNSEGESCVGPNQSALDLDAALCYVESAPEFAGLPVLLYGHSWGGYAVSAVLPRGHDIAAAVSVAGFNRPMQMVIEWIKDSMGLLSYIEYPYIYLYQLALFGAGANAGAVDAINRADTPVLVIQGDADTVIPPDSAAIYASRDSITNPNVQYIVRSEPGQNGHSNLVQSKEALRYGDELDEELDRLREEYGGEIPEAELDRFYSSVDRFLVSEVDAELFDQIVAFCDSAVERAG